MLGRTLLLGSLLGLMAAAQAEIYQYKDENGKTVFSERPPPNGAQAKIVTPKTRKTAAGAADKLQQDRERIVPSEKPVSAQAKKDEKPALTPEQEEQKARACEQARQALALLRENNRPRYETEDGQVAFMTPEMQQARMADAEEKIGKYCE